MTLNPKVCFNFSRHFKPEIEQLCLFFSISSIKCLSKDSQALATHIGYMHDAGRMHYGDIKYSN